MAILLSDCRIQMDDGRVVDELNGCDLFEIIQSVITQTLTPPTPRPGFFGPERIPTTPIGAPGGGFAGGGFGGFPSGGGGAPGPQGPPGPAGPPGPSGGGWTDDGTVVRLTTVSDTVAIGTATMFAGEKVRIVGDTRIEGKLTVTGVIDPTAVILSDPGGGTSLFYESFPGQTAPVSGPTTGRIRYNNTTGTWQVSTQGSPYTDLALGTGNAFVQGGNSFGTDAILGTNDAFPLTIETAGSERARFTTAGQLFMGTTASPLVTSGERLRIVHNVNGSTFLTVNNGDAGTLAQVIIRAAVVDAIPGPGQHVDLVHTGTGFTPSGGLLANEGAVRLGVGSDSLAIATVGADPIRFVTTALERGRFAPTGEFLVGTTTVTAGHIGRFERNVIGVIQLVVSNTNVSTTTQTIVRAFSDTSNAAIGHTSSAFVPAGSGRVANEGFLAVPSTSASLAIITEGADPIRILTTALERYRFEAGGNLTMMGDFDFVPSVDDDGEIGTDALRFSRVRAVAIVPGDLELMNKDGSKHWTIREGTEDVFAVNHRNGKKYKLVLEEVSEVPEADEVEALV